MDTYAEIIVDIQSQAVDRLFHYRVPPVLQPDLRAGHRVIVPFGSRKLVGYVMGIVDHSPVNEAKPILKILDEEPLLTGEMVDLARWLAQHTYCRLIDALRCLLPPGIHIKSEKYVELAQEHVDCALERLKERAPKQEAVLRYLLEVGGEAPWDDVLGAVQCGSSVINILAEKGYLNIKHRWTSPAVKKKRVQVCRLNVPVKEAEAWVEANMKRAPKQAEVITRLIETETVWTVSSLAAAANTTSACVRALEEKGLIKRFWQEVYRDPYGEGVEASQPLTPNPAQRQALQEIHKALTETTGGVFLLRGVTGSGKTEVYLQAIAKALELGKQAIVLVPEISLTPQTVQRFKARFGGRVAVLHSALSGGERFDEWRRVRNGDADIVVGARSAVFAPFTRLGLIIIDEEHEQSYRQEDMPRYHARDVALWRAKRHGAVVVLGSATPSVESAYLAETGVYRQLVLPERIETRPLPPVEIVDMRAELKHGNRSMLSRRLRLAISQRLQKREQMIILLNRRGYATCVLCRECGHVMQCKNCRVTLTYHEPDRSVRCHYCGWQVPLPRLCPECRSQLLRRFGVGTQRVEEVLLREFPGARVLRMDMDTTRRKGAHRAILGAFERGEADILLGTQMIAKGLDFPNVTLVGVISADTSLSIPDFRAGERTFQLLTQVAGRAGRGDKGGEVIIQTYNPEHYSIQAAAAHDYTAFYQEELSFRREMGYPPYAFLARVLISGPAEGEVMETAHKAWEALRQLTADLGLKPQDVGIFGPMPAPLSLVRKRYRWHIIVKGEEEAVRRCLGAFTASPDTYPCSVSVDAAPSALL
ncbi:MAG TPA: primosomal protein N' [Firmicutes bacterium]|nr:primosomal protein N' [Bacillota bacterium]